MYTLTFYFKMFFFSSSSRVPFCIKIEKRKLNFIKVTFLVNYYGKVDFFYIYKYIFQQKIASYIFFFFLGSASLFENFADRLAAFLVGVVVLAPGNGYPIVGSRSS